MYLAEVRWDSCSLRLQHMILSLIKSFKLLNNWPRRNCWNWSCHVYSVEKQMTLWISRDSAFYEKKWIGIFPYTYKMFPRVKRLLWLSAFSHAIKSPFSVNTKMFKDKSTFGELVSRLLHRHPKLRELKRSRSYDTRSISNHLHGNHDDLFLL